MVAPRIPFRGRTRLIAWAKVILPLITLALLSTVFLLAREPGGAVPFARIAAIAREQRVESPRLAGVAADGTAVALEADRLRPIAGRPDAFLVDGPRLSARAPGGATAAATAVGGVADGRGETLEFQGPVRVESSAGVTALLPSLVADLGRGTLSAPGPVTADAPWGSIEAGGLRVEGGDDARLLFTGGVRLLYLPPSEEPAP